MLYGIKIYCKYIYEYHMEMDMFLWIFFIDSESSQRQFGDPILFMADDPILPVSCLS